MANELEKEEEKSLVLFRDLTKDSQPINPRPELSLGEYKYTQRHEPKCVICTSHLRNELEHIYIESSQSPQTVIRYFEEIYGAKLNYRQVRTHCENHCRLNTIYNSGLENYKQRSAELSDWMFRETQLALTALMIEIDDIRGMDLGNNPDKRIKRAAQIERLVSKMYDISKERDAKLSQNINVVDVLHDLHSKMMYPEDKKIVNAKIEEIIETLTKILEEN
jgi:hypothetical protein